MTKEKILKEFSDINHVYNNCTRYDTLKHMLDELTEPKTGRWIEPQQDDGMSDPIYYQVRCSEYSKEGREKDTYPMFEEQEDEE